MLVQTPMCAFHFHTILLFSRPIPKENLYKDTKSCYAKRNFIKISENFSTSCQEKHPNCTHKQEPHGP